MTVDSAPSLGVYYFLSLTLSVCISVSPFVCLSVTLFLQIASSFLFLHGIEPFLAISSPCGTLQNYFKTIFDLGLLTPKIYSPKFGAKSPISRLVWSCIIVWQIHRGCLGMFGPTKGYSGTANSMEPYKMLWGRPLWPWKRNFGKFGLFFTKSPISRLVCHIHRICLGPPGEITMGPIFVAMATTFALGAESNRLPACFTLFLV